MALNTHPDKDRLELYVLDRIGEGERIDIEIHMLTCNSCMDRVANLEDYTNTLKDALSAMYPKAASKRDSKKHCYIN